MKRLNTKLLSLAIALFLVSGAQAQIRTPAPSVAAKTTVAVGLTDITIEYSRPSRRGRTIFDDKGVVPYGQVWRTGANSATKITFSDDVKIDGKLLKKGSYAILSIPNVEKWAVHFYPYESTNWTSYVEKTPELVVEAQVMPARDNIETFTMDVNNIEMDNAHLVIAWEETAVHILFTVDVDTKVMANINQVMAGPNGDDYFAAASYIHESGKDLNKALEYINKATAGDSPKFWQVRRKALILADLGKKEEAIKAAQQSLDLAKVAKNDDYVRMNEASIKEWTAKKK